MTFMPEYITQAITQLRAIAQNRQILKAVQEEPESEIVIHKVAEEDGQNSIYHLLCMVLPHRHDQNDSNTE